MKRGKGLTFAAFAVHRVIPKAGNSELRTRRKRGYFATERYQSRISTPFQCTTPSKLET